MMTMLDRLQATTHRPLLQGRHKPILFSGIMALSVGAFMSAFLTAVNTGFDAGYIGRWLHAFSMAAPIAFVLVQLIAPRVTRLVNWLVGERGDDR